MWLIYYTGHGSNSGPSTPLYLSGEDEFKFNIPPINYSFACLTNVLSDTLNFGYTWIKNYPYGGVANYGSTTNTSVDTDIFFSKNMFMSFAQSNTLGRNIAKGLMKYYNACRTSTRTNQIKRYNLFGDPSLTLTGTPAYPINPITDSKNHNNNSIENLWSIDCIDNTLYYDSDSDEICKLDIFDMNGKIILSQQIANSGTIDCSEFGKGMYIAIISSVNGEFYANRKFIINH